MRRSFPTAPSAKSADCGCIASPIMTVRRTPPMKPNQQRGRHRGVAEAGRGGGIGPRGTARRAARPARRAFRRGCLLASGPDQPWPVAVASSLTEWFAPDLMAERILRFQTPLPWVADYGLDYFRSRVPRARDDSREALDLTTRPIATRRNFSSRPCAPSRPNATSSGPCSTRWRWPTAGTGGQGGDMTNGPDHAARHYRRPGPTPPRGRHPAAN